MANGNLTKKKEPKIVENDHKSLKKQKSIKKGYKLSKIAVNGRKEQKKCRQLPKKHKFGFLKKLEKNTTNRKFKIWAWLCYHATPSCGNIYNY